MRIDSPIMSNAIITGSFLGSVTPGVGSVIQATAIAYDNITSKPALISSSAQITALGYSTTDNELTQEEVEDFAGALVATGGTKTGITVTYDDANGNMDFVVASQTDQNFTTADHSKLDGIEASADVTDATNVTAAGALMDSEVTNLAQVKAFDSSDYATAAQGSTADSAQQPPSEGAFADGDRTKLDAIEASADVTDATNVTAAGALMDSEVTNLAQVKAFDSSSYATAAQGTKADSAQQPPSEGAFANGDKTKLDAIEASADVTDATNVTAAGALMDSELSSEASVKAINQGLATGDDVQFNDLTVAGNLTVSGTTTSINSTDLNVTDKLISINRGGADAASANGAGLFISGASESITWDNGNTRFNFSDDVHAAGNITLTGTVDGRDVDTDGTKLDTIESSADVTDATNVTAAGALMDSEVTNLSFVKGLTKGISDGNVLTANDVVADNDFLRINGTEVEGLTAAEVRTAINVENGATADQSKADIDGLAITTVGTIDTGVWNGTAITSANLDADTAHLTGTQTFSGAKTFSNTLIVTKDTASTSKTTGAVKVTGGVGIQGDLFAGGDVVAYASSDERLKDNISNITNALDKVEALKGVSFDWNDKQSVYNGHDIGVIAQDVEAVLPELVENRDNGFKAVKYDKLTAVLIEAVKELSAKVKELENK